MSVYEKNLLDALRRRSLKAVCLGGGFYLRLGTRLLAKAAFTHRGGYADALRLTVLNRHTGPIDFVTIPFWELPKCEDRTAHVHEEDLALCVQRPMPDMDALADKMLEYLALFRDMDDSISRCAAPDIGKR